MRPQPRAAASDDDGDAIGQPVASPLAFNVDDGFDARFDRLARHYIGRSHQFMEYVMVKPTVDDRLLQEAIERALAIADAQNNNLVAALLAEALDAAGGSEHD